jgi:hypothetical protein
VSGSRELRAPRADGAVVAEPPLSDIGRLLTTNRQRLAQPGPDFLGRPWQDLQSQARQAAVAAARDYLRQAGDPVPGSNSISLLLAGHQPELFHPGVWVKHFALNGLARRHGAVPVNLVVDNDTVKATALSVPVFHVPPPSIDEFQPRAITVPFDRWTNEVPYEERTVRDEELFASFPDRVPRDWGFRPLLEDFWPEVCRHARRTPLLGERFAAARRVWERRWGCHNLELPISRLSATEPFAWFGCHLLADLPRFHAIYNACVHAYRRAHGIRSRNHPVPDLAREDDWLEAPFWAWHAGQARRGRLFVRVTQGTLELRAGSEPWPALPPSTTEPVRAWQELERRGFKLRPRALTNTLYARLLLADLFIHGIGGGKYDELTDAIIRRFYGIEPPGYLILSATLLLPFPTYPAGPEDCQGLTRELRDLHWNPQRHLDQQASPGRRIQELAAQKQVLIAQQPTDRQGRRARFQALRALTEHLRQGLAGREQDVQRELDRCGRRLRANALLRRRDYSFCLYPEALLRPFCTRFLE